TAQAWPDVPEVVPRFHAELRAGPIESLRRVTVVQRAEHEVDAVARDAWARRLGTEEAVGALDPVPGVRAVHGEPAGRREPEAPGAPRHALHREVIVREARIPHVAVPDLAFETG